MKKTFYTALVLASALVSSAASAAGIAYNSTPADGWFYGSGNNYSPANTAVLTTSQGNQLYLRNHITFQQAPASVGNTYKFALGSTPISFDWGIDGSGGDLDFTSALITLKNVKTGATTSYNPFFPGNDNASANGSFQNSARFTFAFLNTIGFNPNIDSTYRTTLSISGLDGSKNSLSINAQLGAGAVPEPATWAMMIGGFGAVGAALRRKSRARVTFA